MNPDTVRWHILFSGRVQFVGFRYRACLYARNLSLTGWVRNLADGRVEMEVQGSVSLIRKLLVSLKGSSSIRISHMDIEPMEPVDGERHFQVKDPYS